MQLAVRVEGKGKVKTAGQFLLGDNPNTFSSEILAHLYKQHPFLGRYSVNMDVNAQDDSLGYMHATFTVTNASDAPPVQEDTRMGQVTREPVPPAPEQTVRIPVVVRDKKLFSFDTFITPDGKSLPLSESRLASVLFDPSAFSAAPKPDASDAGGSLDANFAPEAPQTVYGAGYSGGRQETKTASVSPRSALLSSVVLSDQEKTAFLDRVAADPELQALAFGSEAFKGAILRVGENGVGAEKTAAVDQLPADADVLCLYRTPAAAGSGDPYMALGGTYSAGGDYPVMSKHAMVFIGHRTAESIPTDVRESVMRDGFALVTGATEPLRTLGGIDKLAVAEKTGAYGVMDQRGNSRKAVVVVGLDRFTGGKSDMSLVMSDVGAAYQEKVAGVWQHDMDFTALPDVQPVNGEGVFLSKTAGMVSEPVTVRNTVTGPDGTYRIGEHPLLGNIRIKTAAVARIVPVSDTEFLIPEDSMFIAMAFNQQYEENPGRLEKTGSRSVIGQQVTLTKNANGGYRLTGDPITGGNSGDWKMPAERATYLLGCLGDTDEGAKQKLAHVEDHGAVTFVATAKLRVERTKELPGAYEKAASAMVRADLVKEAANLPSTDTVDSVLSLNFVTPENIRGYVDYLPTFEDTVSKLAELLLGVRLGLAEVPESAVLSAMNGVEKAIMGLKRLSLQSDVAG